MFTEGENVILAIMYTFLYTIVSVIMAFKTATLLDDELSVERLAKHFIIWPIECLFIGILVIKVYIAENYTNKK